MDHAEQMTALAATPTILHALLINADAVRNSPAGDEGWTPREVVAHLRDCEEFRLLRCRLMRDLPEPFIAAFDQEALARDRDYGATNIAAALKTFERLRGQVVELLADLNEESWQRAGRHEELGRITVETHIDHAIAHDLVHMRQIAESLNLPAQ